MNDVRRFNNELPTEEELDEMEDRVREAICIGNVLPVISALQVLAEVAGCVTALSSVSGRKALVDMFIDEFLDAVKNVPSMDQPGFNTRAEAEQRQHEYYEGRKSN